MGKRGAEVSAAGARLHWLSTPERAERVVLLLHGRAGIDEQRPSVLAGAVLRMLPFGWAVSRAARREVAPVAVARLVYAQRRWHESDRPDDARWALSRVSDRYPGRPAGLIAHSMGVRTALQVAAKPMVDRVAGYAAWVEADDAASWPSGGHAAGLQLRLVHGADDRITEPRGSEFAAERLREVGAQVSLEIAEGETHAMLRQARRWHADAARTMLHGLPR